MFITHKLRKGETFSTVMRRYGVKDWKQVWDLDQNKKLKAKRRTADKVVEGDELTLLDPKAKFYPLYLNGRKYNVPFGEYEGVKSAVQAQIKKKFLPEVIRTKAIYDADYEYMWEIANGNGWLTGMLAGIVENRTGAKLPTTEMNKVSAAIKKLTKAVAGKDYKGLCDAMKEADKAMAAYVAAAETYRRKMTDGSSKGVKALETTRDGCFIVAMALATGGASTVVGTAFTAVEIGAALGAATGFVKAASGEIGNALAGEDRSGGEIGFNLVASTLLGGATGALGGLAVGTFGKYASSAIGKHISGNLPRLVRWVVKAEGTAWLGLGSKVTDEVAAKLIGMTLARIGMGTIMLEVNKLMRKELDKVAAAMGEVLKGCSGREAKAELGKRLGDALVKQDFAQSVVRSLSLANADAIRKQAEKAGIAAE